MLTIKNLNKLNNKQLGKKNFYVESITEEFSMDNTNLLAVEHQYKFELSNKKYGITVILNREPVQKNGLGTYFELRSSTGYKYHIDFDEIANIDIFIDKLRYVALG